MDRTSTALSLSQVYLTVCLVKKGKKCLYVHRTTFADTQAAVRQVPTMRLAVYG